MSYYEVNYGGFRTEKCTPYAGTDRAAARRVFKKHVSLDSDEGEFLEPVTLRSNGKIMEGRLFDHPVKWEWYPTMPNPHAPNPEPCDSTKKPASVADAHIDKRFSDSELLDELQHVVGA